MTRTAGAGGEFTLFLRDDFGNIAAPVAPYLLTAHLTPVLLDSPTVHPTLIAVDYSRGAYSFNYTYNRAGMYDFTIGTPSVELFFKFIRIKPGTACIVFFFE